MQNRIKKQGFTFFELAVSCSLFFLLLEVMYPNILLFFKSYTSLTKYTEYRFHEKEVHRLLRQLLFHIFPHNDLTESCFLLKAWNFYWMQNDISILEKQKQKIGKVAVFSCLFLKIGEELTKNIFLLYFEQHGLYLMEYRNGVFHFGNRILLLENVEGYFEREGNLLKMYYWREGQDRKREVIYEILPTR